MPNMLEQMAGQAPDQQPESTTSNAAAASGSSGNMLQQLAGQAPQGSDDTGELNANVSTPTEFNVDDDSANILQKGLRAVNAVGAGMGKGLLDTMASGVHMANSMGLGADGLENTLNDRREELRKDNFNNPVLNSIGYGGETLMEFLMGDEALKGLSMADRMAQSAKVAKMLEKSPRIMQALKMGAVVGKASASLSPEERTLVQNYPVLGRLVHAGMEATRGGLVQGAQSTFRTRDPIAGAKDAVTAGLTQGVLGGVTGGLGGVMAKGADAANTVDEMLARANKSDATAAGASAKLDQMADSAYGPDMRAAEGSARAGKEELQDTAAMGTSQKGLAERVGELAKSKEDEFKGTYQQRSSAINDLAKDDQGNNITTPYHESPIRQFARQQLGVGMDESGPMDEAMRRSLPGSEKVNGMLESLAQMGTDPNELNRFQTGETDMQFLRDAGIEPHMFSDPAIPGSPAPIDLDVPYLQKMYRLAGERYRALGYSTGQDRADKEIYAGLRGSILDTVGKVAEASGNPDAMDLYKTMNEDYKSSVKLFQNKDVQGIMAGNLDDVQKKLTSGQTYREDVEAVKQALGRDNFHEFAQESLANTIKAHIGEDGQVNLPKLASFFKTMGAEKARAFYGDTTANQFSKVMQQIATGDSDAKAIGKTMGELVGKGNVESLIKDPAYFKDFQQRVGPSGMADLGNYLLDSKINEASTMLDPKTGQVVKGKFNADHVLDWFMSMKDNPELRNSLFTPDAKSAGEYNELMRKLQNVSSVKKITKYGILPITLGTTGAVHGGPMIALLGATAGAATEGFGKARDILETIANHPAMWSAYKKANSVFNSGTGKVAARALGATTGASISPSARDVYSQLGSSL